MRALLAVTAVLAACPTLVACAGAPAAAPGDGDAPGDGAEDAPAEAPAFPACNGAETQTITFVHVNDLHAAFNPPEPGAPSPYALVRGFYEAALAENPYTLFTNGGDDHEKGSLADLVSDGAATIALVRAMGFDVRVLGNHDYAFSVPQVTELSRDPRAIVLSSNNLRRGNDPAAWGAVPTAVMTVGCVKLGFIGLVSKPWDARDRQYDGDYFPQFAYDADFAGRTAALAAELRPQVDLIVMVNHMGAGDDAELASRVTGIDVILGGHSHTPMSKVRVVNGTRIIQAGSSAGFVARLDLDVRIRDKAIVADRYRLAPVIAGTMPVSEPVQAAVAAELRRWVPDLRSPVGTVAAQTVSNDAVAAVAARAALAAARADAAIIDPRTVWSSWQRGTLDRQGCLDTFKVEREPPGTPGFNSLYTVEVSGADLAAIRAGKGTGPRPWPYAGVENPDPALRYVLALQKRPALHPDEELPAGVTVGAPTFRMEMWRALCDYAAARTAAGKAIDADEPASAAKSAAVQAGPDLSHAAQPE